MEQASTVSIIRDTLLKEIISEDLNVHERDLERFKSQDWFIQKFINFNKKIHQNDPIDEDQMVQEVAKKMRKTLEYRFDNKVNEVEPTLIPRELFVVRGLRQSSKSNSINKHLKMFYIDVTVFKKIDQSADIMADTLCFLAERELREFGSDGKDMALMIEYTNIRYENIDVMFCVKMAYMILKAYSFMGSQIILYDPPWFFRPFIKLFSSFFPEKYTSFFRMLTAEEAKNDSDFRRDMLPDFLGGDVETDRIPFLEESRPLHEVAIKKSIKFNNYLKMRKWFESLLTEKELELYNLQNKIPLIDDSLLKNIFDQ